MDNCKLLTTLAEHIFPISDSNYNASGFAHFLFSIFPVFVHRISCHDTGSIVPPSSLVANITPRSFLAVVTK